MPHRGAYANVYVCSTNNSNPNVFIANERPHVHLFTHFYTAPLTHLDLGKFSNSTHTPFLRKLFAIDGQHRGAHDSYQEHACVATTRSPGLSLGTCPRSSFTRLDNNREPNEVAGQPRQPEHIYTKSKLTRKTAYIRIHMLWTRRVTITLNIA